MSQSKTKPKRKVATATKVVRQPQPILSPRRTAVILACLFALGVWLRVHHMSDVAQRTPDESTYTTYADQIAARGWSAFPSLVSGYNYDTRLHMYPPPTRVGHLVLLAGMMNLSGAIDERAGTWLSSLASVLSLALMAWVAYRFLPPLAGVYAMFFLAFSVPDLVDARRGWQDSVVAFFGLVMLWCACEIGRDPGRWWPYAVLVAAGSYSVLMKELMAFVYLGCVVYVLALLIGLKAWRSLVGFVVAGLVGAGLSTLALSAAAGGFDQVVMVWNHLNAVAKDNPYMNWQNGPWYRWVWGFWILSPVNTVMAIVAAGLAVTPARVLERLQLPWRPTDLSRLRLFSGLTLLLAVLMKVLPNTQNFRYMAPVYAAMYCMGGMALWALWEWAGRNLKATTRQALAALAVILVLGTTVTGYLHYERKFVVGQVPDLSIKMVVDSR